MDDWADDGESKRAILRNVAAYRELCKQVRSKATGGLVFGVIMLGIWYMLIPDKGPHSKYEPFGLIYLGLAALEFTSALWKKLAPSAEGVLLDGVVLLCFGGANMLRQYLLWQANPADISYILLCFGAFWLFQGFNTIRSYGQLRKAFSFRPSRDHMRWFDNLLKEVRKADPETDPDALDLPTEPPVRGKLLGDMAVFLVAARDTPFIVGREEVEIERRPSRNPDRPPLGYLFIGPDDFGDFPIDPDNWRNYERWKTEGGQPPGPPLVRPVSR